MLRISNLEKSYETDGRRVPAVRGVSIDVASGEFYTLLGPSGCGKTTILNCIAGLESPDTGEIVMGDTVVYCRRRHIELPAHRRNLGMVFQSYAIWPHMTVFENVAFPLVHGHGKRSTTDSAVRDRVHKALALVQLESLADRPTPYLSGGQQQRVALARALVHEPQLLLFDEPLSNLDARLREEMRGEIRRVTETLGITTIYVTHDQVEALSMSDRIALLKDGEIVQQGTPRAIYFQPSSAFVAGFMGASNIVAGRLVRAAGADGLGAVETAIGRIFCRIDAASDVGDAVEIVVRREAFQLCEPGDTTGNVLEGQIERTSFVGDGTETCIAIKGERLMARLDSLVTLTVGQTIRVAVMPHRCTAIPATRPHAG